jgi:hypothetical protein
MPIIGLVWANDGAVVAAANAKPRAVVVNNLVMAVCSISFAENAGLTHLQ